MHTSSRNSEVIHAGIHYEPNSLKARLCRAGRDLLYRYCAERGIPHRRCGKFTVATTALQLATLEKIELNARANDVLDLEWLDQAEARRVEPELNCIRALSSPSTGIIDSHILMQSLLADAEGSGANIAYDTKVTRLRPPRLGPDTEWVNCIDYAVDPARASLFAEVIRQYWPGLDPARLYPAYAGIRPKISGAGETSRDFCISGPKEHGVAGVVNVFGIESP